MPGPPFLHGERVDLYTVVEVDAESEFIARGRDDPAVRPWPLRSRPHAVAEAREDVEGYMSDDGDGLGLLACVDGDPVGLLSMFTFEADSGRAFIGARFVPEAQGKGYGTDAVGRLVEYDFDERRLHRVGAGARADNDASRATLEKLGFVREGRHLSQRGSPAVHGINESLCDSFAHQKSSISGDINESFALVCTSESRSDSEDVDETRSVSFVSRRNGVPADSSEIFDFRDTRTLRVLRTGGNRVS